MSATESALSRARELAAKGAGLAHGLATERAHLQRAIETELHVLASRAEALAPAAQAGDREASDRLLSIVQAKGDLLNALEALNAQGDAL